MDALIQPFLRRTDTERPKLTSSLSSPSKGGAPTGEGSQLQITALLDALNTAKKELEAHNTRLREVEELLVQERQARESAEERAQRLENERNETRSIHEDLRPLENIELNGAPVLPNGIPSEDAGADGTTDSDMDAGAPPATLQERLEQVLGNMNEMKIQMERYRIRAEKAEEASARDRSTLSQMIEQVRRDEERRAARTTSRGRRSRSQSPPQIQSAALDGLGESRHLATSSERSANGDITELLRKASLQNGRPVTPAQVKQLEDAVNQALAATATATKHRRGEQLAHVGPYASILGVVFAGVALMAYLNGWQKIER